ncbi:DUF2169 domain-containing protein [Rhodovulum sulfidophilum]|uniref:DUF2169 domain-containing protein n=1 Tax=Rhodovulum sulfidophilum TaxID=35806 RepID=UPI002E31C991|nr:DUF2169 domain-containing protein [Rhodovulum sulfidophilum]
MSSAEHPMSLDPARPADPEGFGPVPPWWQMRARHAGTYDRVWAISRAAKAAAVTRAESPAKSPRGMPSSTFIVRQVWMAASLQVG